MKPAAIGDCMKKKYIEEESCSQDTLDSWRAGVLERPRTWGAGDCEGGRPRRAGVARQMNAGAADG